jgi:hypothetical protein
MILTLLTEGEGGVLDFKKLRLTGRSLKEKTESGTAKYGFGKIYS